MSDVIRFKLDVEFEAEDGSIERYEMPVREDDQGGCFARTLDRLHVDFAAILSHHGKRPVLPPGSCVLHQFEGPSLDGRPEYCRTLQEPDPEKTLAAYQRTVEWARENAS